MGVELGGTITEMHSKLSAKGLTVTSNSQKLPAGQREYKGIFSGKKATICIWYNARTKLVYRGKAIIEVYGKSMVIQEYKEMAAKLDLKYGVDNKTTDVVKDDYINELEQSSWLVNNGRIDLFITSTGYSAQNTFYLHVDYNDAQNTIANTAEEMNDL